MNVAEEQSAVDRVAEEFIQRVHDGLPTGCATLFDMWRDAFTWALRHPKEKNAAYAEACLQDLVDAMKAAGVKTI